MTDHSLYVWHAVFCYCGTLNDITIWESSMLLQSICDGSFAENDFPFSIGGEMFNMLWMLVDGIYPPLGWFVKPLTVPIVDSKALSSLWQESKCKDIEQSITGDRFVVCYNTDGVFFLRDFFKEAVMENQSRNPAEVEKSILNVNDLVGIKDRNTMCHNLFYEPFITCCFIDDKTIFVSLFENYSLTHYHFFFNIDTKEIVGEIAEYNIENYSSNFPFKCMYNDDDKEIYSFYKQGESFTIKETDAKLFTMDRITDRVLGTMYLMYNKALVAGTSDSTTFFKL